MTHPLTKLAVVSALAFAAGAPAQADTPKPTGPQGAQVSIKPNGFSPISIDVISQDGKNWTTVKDKALLLRVTVGIGKRNVEVTSYQVRQGWPSQTSEQPWLYTRNFDNPVARADKNLTISGSTAHFSPAERTSFLKGCNAKLAGGGSVDKTYTFFSSAKLQLVAYFTSPYSPSINQGGNVGKFGNGTATVRVVCKGKKSGGDSFAAEQPSKLKVKSLQLFRSTYANVTSSPNPGTRCKKAKLLVRLKTNKSGPVKFRLWTKIGNQQTTSKVIDTWSNFSGPGEFKAEYSEWVSVNKTTFVQAKAEEMINPIGMSTSWKSITLRCTGAGGGGLADAPKPGNDNPQIAPLKVTGNLTLADKAGAPKDKPRLGAAVFKLWANKPGNTSYKLTCSGGRQWTGTLPTFKIANKKYQAVGQHNFQIAKTETIGCAIRSTSMSSNVVVALATKQFRLIRRNPQLGGVDKVTGKSRPTTRKIPAKRLKAKAERLEKKRQAAKQKALLKKRRQAAKKAAQLKRRRLAAKAALLKSRQAAKKAALLKKRRLEKLQKSRLARIKAKRAERARRLKQRGRKKN